jgi:hypothetical protein
LTPQWVEERRDTTPALAAGVEELAVRAERLERAVSGDKQAS